MPVVMSLYWQFFLVLFLLWTKNLRSALPIDHDL